MNNYCGHSNSEIYTGGCYACEREIKARTSKDFDNSLVYQLDLVKMFTGQNKLLQSRIEKLEKALNKIIKIYPPQSDCHCIAKQALEEK